MFSILIARRRLVAGLMALLGAATVVTAYALEPPLTFAVAVQRGLARAPQLAAQDAGFVAAQEEAARAA